MFKTGSQLSWNNALEKKLLKAANPMSVGVGVSKDAVYPNGTKVEVVAFRMEYGGEKVPPRSFMRSVAIEKRDEWKAKMKECLTDIIHGNNAKNALDALGSKIREDVVGRIDELSAPPLAPSTIAGKKKKGSPKPEKPLIDTGLLKSSIKVEVQIG